ncbi:hypothetical protein [Bacillus sp. Marseille-P3661]|uniref:hypothetical protein n=1 Tax=Bacillus sp. Marseille-P3661 TaxID=1936234 RepID=UPI000C84784E|nr:hypothetical protein [Bacillus sp. Marseille-P3661]
MPRNFNLDPGYITVPKANKIVLQILRTVDQHENSHYSKILRRAKIGLLGGKKHGKRMYQVRKKDIMQYAEECLKVEQLKLFNKN